MRKILCFFGIHNYGKQFNIRKNPDYDPLMMYMIPILCIAAPWVILFGQLETSYKKCDRECLRCGKLKTFDYDRDIGE